MSPSLRRHKGTRRAYVRVRGKNHYLGAWPDGQPDPPPEALQRYHALLAEMAATGLDAPLQKVADITVAEALERYLEYAGSYYEHGETGGQVGRVRAACLAAVNLYGFTLAREFGPLKLRAVQAALVERGYTRRNINAMVGCLRLAFKRLASHEVIPAEVSLALTTVPGLRRGKSKAKESTPVRPVALEDVGAACTHLSPVVAAMVWTQLWSGARPGEVVQLRAGDIDTSTEVWTARLAQHKTAHHGLERTLYFGPRAQKALRPLLLRAADAYVFSPRESEAWRHAQAETHRRPGQVANAKKTDRELGACYTVVSYRQAIARACRRAGIEAWKPNQLRHTFATLLRQEHGLEAAQVVLGHTRADTTQIYAETDERKAIAAIAAIG